MHENVFSVADVIQLVLMLTTCYVCYLWGRRDGIVQLATVLVDAGKITEKDLEE